MVFLLFWLLVGRPMGGRAIVPRTPPPGYATVFTPDVMSIHNVSRLLQFLLSGFTFAANWNDRRSRRVFLCFYSAIF